MLPTGALTPRARALLIAAVAALAYGGALDNDFAFDDVAAVRDNPQVRRFDLAEILRSDYWSGFHGDRAGLYRPLTVLSFALHYRLAGAEPLTYHLLNVLLHAACAWGVYRLGCRLFAAAPTALLAALLFAAHPALSESVCAVVGRADLLATGLGLAAALLHLRHRYGRAAGALFLSLLCKESALALPALLALVGAFQYRLFSQKCHWRAYLLYALVALFYLGWRWRVLGGLGVGPIDPLDNPLAAQPLPLRWLDAGFVVLRYLGLLALPAHLSADYSYAALSLSQALWSPRLALLLAALAALLLLAGATWRRLPQACFGLLWTLLALAPVANIALPIGTIMAERLLYLPGAGFCLGLAALLAARPRRRQPLLEVLLIALLAARSSARTADWQDDYVLFTQTARTSPHSARAWRGLGRAALERGLEQEALAAFARALRIWPQYYEVHNDLAAHYLRRGDAQAARRHLATCLQQRPDYPPAWLNLGLALYQLGEKEGAQKAFAQALALDPRYAAAAYNLGVALLEAGQRDEAAVLFARAARLQPEEYGAPGRQGREAKKQ